MSQSLYFACDMHRRVGPEEGEQEREQYPEPGGNGGVITGPQALLEYRKHPLECSALLAAAALEDAARKNSGHFLQATVQCPGSLD